LQFDARATEKVVAIAIDAPCLRAKAQADDALGRALAERVAAMLLDRLQTTRIRVLNLYDEDGAATREAPGEAGPRADDPGPTSVSDGGRRPRTS